MTLPFSQCSWEIPKPIMYTISFTKLQIHCPSGDNITVEDIKNTCSRYMYKILITLLSWWNVTGFHYNLCWVSK